jgi:hypothetical protein
VSGKRNAQQPAQDGANSSPSVQKGGLADGKRRGGTGLVRQSQAPHLEIPRATNGSFTFGFKPAWAGQGNQAAGAAVDKLRNGIWMLSTIGCEAIAAHVPSGAFLQSEQK